MRNVTFTLFVLLFTALNTTNAQLFSAKENFENYTIGETAQGCSGCGTDGTDVLLQGGVWTDLFTQSNPTGYIRRIAFDKRVEFPTLKAAISGSGANGSSKSLKVSYTTLATLDNECWLEMYAFPAGSATNPVTMSFYAKTDAAGVTNGARVRILSTSVLLTEEWQQITVDNYNIENTTKIKLFDKYYYVGGKAFNIWFDEITFTEVAPTAINDVKDNLFTIYPNPASSQITVDGAQQIEVIDISGKTVLEVKDVSGSINVSSLTKGYYLVKGLVDGQIGVQKLVIK